tara:strand:+ start:1854 stop:2063 length:210 start_codon:yes stop_codon:yes gene_type:complete
MKIRKQMAIMSHLSDCQEMIQFEGQEERTRMRINFVKMILTDGNQLDHEYTTDELDKIWEKTNEMCGIQ